MGEVEWLVLVLAKLITVGIMSTIVVVAFSLATRNNRKTK
jgi:hypothetical protein